MGNFAVLGGLIINCVVVGLPIICLIILLVKEKGILSTIVISLFFLLTTANAIYFFISAHNRKIKVSKQYLGFYKLNRLDCKDCEDCKINFHSDYRYDIIKNGSIVGKGEWDLEINAETGFFLKLDNGPGYMIYDTPREIASIDRKDCCVAGCEENFEEEFSGKIVDIELEGTHFGQGTIFIQTINGDTIKYYPKYFRHPWIKDKIQVGDYFSKSKNAMSFTVVGSKGDTTFLNYQPPNCEDACNTDKMIKDVTDSLDKTRK